MTDNGTSIADVLAALDNSPTPTREVKLCLRPDLVARHDELEAELAEAVVRDATAARLVNERTPIADAIDALEAEMDATSTTFVLQSVPPLEWQNLLRDHGPTAEQRKLRYDHNPETFQPAALAACCVAPKMSVEEATALYQNPKVTSGQWETLWVACHTLNRGGVDVPKSQLAIGIRQLNGQSLTSAANRESPEASSLGDAGPTPTAP